MKNVLKIWLVDNTVTVDNKDDKIGQLESSGNLSLQDMDFVSLRSEATVLLL